MKIKFISKVIDPTLPQPIQASKKIPDWYKSIERYVGGEKKPPRSRNDTNGTIKTCMPILDAITSGYLILSACDVFIDKSESDRYYSWADYNLIKFHGQQQVTGYPKLEQKMGTERIPKFENLWIVQTPKGYSSLFITPFHQDLPFTILPGIVDTDTYHDAVNFPFLPDPDFSGLIPKGTPIAQVIPFRRENWKMNVEQLENSKANKNKFLRGHASVSTLFFDKYKKIFWVPKNYK